MESKVNEVKKSDARRGRIGRTAVIGARGDERGDRRRRQGSRKRRPVSAARSSGPRSHTTAQPRQMGSATTTPATATTATTATPTTSRGVNIVCAVERSGCHQTRHTRTLTTRTHARAHMSWRLDGSKRDGASANGWARPAEKRRLSAAPERASARVCVSGGSPRPQSTVENISETTNHLNGAWFWLRCPSVSLSMDRYVGLVD